MGISVAVNVQISLMADGVSTDFSFDLCTTPVQLPPQTINFGVPNAVSASPGSDFSATLDGHIVTMSFSTAPPAGFIVRGLIYSF